VKVTPTNPFHVSRAYGAPLPAAMQPVRTVGSVAVAGAVQGVSAPAGTDGALGTQAGSGSGGIEEPLAPSKIDRLVAAVVPGGIDFTEEGAMPSRRGGGDALAMYRHPADRNAAATAVHAGRIVDIKG